MKLPAKLPTAPKRSEGANARDLHQADGLTPAGCCAQVCAPFVGCHCVLESPLCP